jgi:NAD(P)-dependent dehydrogenase (short-subunit alcohol dehydrogenase family)
MSCAFITGANRGLGLEFARQYANDGWHVHASVRSEAARSLLAALGPNVTSHIAEMSDSGSISGLAQPIAGTPIDVLICNAGVYQPRDARFGATDYAAWRQVMAINVLGPMALVEALAENVARSELKRMVMISSRAGSMAETHGREYIYASSKTALNSVARSCAGISRDRGITVVTVSPGWNRTEMGGPDAELAPGESIARLREVIASLSLADSGKFLDYTGEEIPW